MPNNFFDYQDIYIREQFKTMVYSPMYVTEILDPAPNLYI